MGSALWGKETDSSQTADGNLGVPLTNCVALRNLLSLFEPPFPDTFWGGESQGAGEN